MDIVKCKVRALAIGILLALPAAVGGQEMHFGLPYLVSVDGKYGYMDANCRMVVPARFDEAFEFTGGLAAVKAGDKWGYIDRSGQSTRAVHCGALSTGLENTWTRATGTSSGLTNRA